MYIISQVESPHRDLATLERGCIRRPTRRRSRSDRVALADLAPAPKSFPDPTSRARVPLCDRRPVASDDSRVPVATRSALPRERSRRLAESLARPPSWRPERLPGRFERLPRRTEATDRRSVRRPPASERQVASTGDRPICSYDAGRGRPREHLPSESNARWTYRACRAPSAATRAHSPHRLAACTTPRAAATGGARQTRRRRPYFILRKGP